MSIRISKPSSALMPYVKQFWSVQNKLPGCKVYSQQIVPNGLIELSFYFGEKPKVVNGRIATLAHRSLITGQLSSPFDIEISGDLELFSITFQPQGAMLFFNMPLSEIMNQAVSGQMLPSCSLDQIEEKLFSARNFKERQLLAERWLYKNVVRNHDHPDFPRMDHCLNLINRSHGMIGIGNLAAATCLGRKQFERVFTRAIGTTPGKFLRVVRFQHAIHQKQMNSAIDLTQLAHDCGYYDQSHMINEFRSLSGLKPTEFFTGCQPYSDYFSN
jgi:AraC-like DNA-binding protein